MTIDTPLPEKSKIDPDGFYYHLADCTDQIRVSKQINENGARRYKGFNSITDACSFIGMNKDKSLHEVLRNGEGGIQRIFMDVDAKYSQFSGITHAQIDHACDLLIASACGILRRGGVDVHDHFELVSHREDKFSKHIVFTNAYIDADHYGCFYKELAQDFAFELDVEELPPKLVDIIDKDVYSTRHCLRLHTSFKFGSNVRLQKQNQETGEVEKDGIFDPNTMVTYIPNERERAPLIYKCPDGCKGQTKKEYAVDATDDHLKIAEQILSQMKDEGITIAKLEKPFIRLNVDHSKPCPVCKEKHDNENVMCAIDSKSLKLICRRKEKGSEKRTRILHTFSKYIEDIPVSIETLGRVIRTHSDYLPSISETVPDFKDLFLLSDLGTGKTKQMMDFIAREFAINKDIRIVFPTYRRTLAEAILKRVNGNLKDDRIRFEKYDKLSSFKINLDEHNRIIVQFESMYRLEPGNEKIDLLIIDEAKSFAQQTISKLGKSGKGPHNQMMLRNLLRNSKRTIIADALLDSPTVEAYQQLLNKENSTIWINECVNQWAPKITIHKDSSAWRNEIAEQVAAGKKLYIPTTYNEFWIKQMRKFILKRVPSAKILMIYAGGEDNQRIVSNIDEVLSQYDVALVSPCMSSGISFDVKGHFDKVYAYIESFGGNEGPSAVDVIQSLRRVRHTTDNEIVICNASKRYQLPTSFKDVFDEQERRLRDNSEEYIRNGFQVERDGYKHYFENPNSSALKFKLYCMRINNLNRIDIFGTVIKYLLGKGGIIAATIEKHEPQSIPAELAKQEKLEFKEGKKEEKLDSYAEIANATVLTQEQFEALNQRPGSKNGIYKEVQSQGTADLEFMRVFLKNFGRTKKEDAQMAKYHLLNFYGLADDFFPEGNKDIRLKPFADKEFVEQYSKRDIMQCYKEMAYRDLTIDKVIELDDRAKNLTDEDKIDYHYLSGRHSHISQIRLLFENCVADYKPVLDCITRLYNQKIHELEHCEPPKDKNLKSLVNKLLKPYGFRVRSKRLGKGATRRRVLVMEDYASEFFEIKRLPMSATELDKSVAFQSGQFQKPVVIVYSP